jgi:hypothetical protein
MQESPVKVMADIVCGAIDGIVTGVAIFVLLRLF